MSTSPFNKYIVFVNGVPGQLNEYANTPKGGILLISSYGTLFSTRDEAKRAIKRTLDFAMEKGYDWSRNEYEIYRAQETGVIVNKRKY